MTLAVNIAQGGSNNVTFRNKIINGAMVIDQRNAGASWSATNGAYGLDRWGANSYDGGNTTGKFTVQQNAGSVTLPTGFSNYLGVTSSAATTYGATGIYTIYQWIEGYNVADLGWGAAGAKPITLSFQVYSSLTGTFGGALQNNAGDRSYPFTYTISSSNTWTSVSVTIAGDTSGTWLKTNGAGIAVRFGLGVGSTYSGSAGAWASANYYSATGAVSVVGTSGATFYITGVQLEAGTTASPFEYRPYTTELCLCQRYYCKSFEPTTVPANGSSNGINTTCAAYSSTSAYVSGFYTYPTQMRATPTVAFYGLNGATGVWDIYKGTWTATTSTVFNNSSSTNLNVFVQSTGMTAWQAYLISGNFTASAEL